jgi:hypothetical protein
MMRRATWQRLEQDILVRVIQSVFRRIGVTLTHKRLAQVVPVIGGVVSAGMSYDMLDRALRDATRVYRVRYLADKYGVSFDDWVERAIANAPAESSQDDAIDEEPIDVEAITRAAIEEQDHRGSEEAPRTDDCMSDGDSR